MLNSPLFTAVSVVTFLCLAGIVAMQVIECMTLAVF